MKEKYIVIIVALISLVFMVLSIIEKNDISLLNLITGIVDRFIIRYWCRREKHE